MVVLHGGHTWKLGSDQGPWSFWAGNVGAWPFWEAPVYSRPTASPIPSESFSISLCPPLFLDGACCFQHARVCSWLTFFLPGKRVSLPFFLFPFFAKQQAHTHRQRFWRAWCQAIQQQLTRLDFLDQLVAEGCCPCHVCIIILGWWFQFVSISS